MTRPSTAVPTGTLTFLFTDIEGSTQLLEHLGPERYRALLEEHQRLLRAAFAANGGDERSTEGDSFFVVFPDAPSAIAAAVAAQRALPDRAPDESVRVRMGIHSGQGLAGGDDYVGLDVHRAARIAAAAHGGQVIISEATRALSTRALPDGVDVVDLGDHRLRGIEAPERLFQLVILGLRSDFPPPRTEPVSRVHVPSRLTSFVGRDADVEALRKVLAINRMVTLVGPGGAGKTSLATECARQAAAAFADGAWFVALESVSDPEVVPETIVATLGLRDPTHRPATELLLENLANRELLLVLDNFEHVMAASSLVGVLVGGAPGLRVISTSRAPLHVSGEQVYPVGPLAVPPRPEQGPGDRPMALDAATFGIVAASAAVRLFVDRAQRVQPAFALTPENAAAVIDICARLDGLPLGIELAAARVPLLGVAGIADRLRRHAALPPTPSRDAPARQRTLREAIAWSHDLLDPSARKLLARLSIFSGGWLLEEAEAICGPADDLGVEVLAGLSELVDQSLVSSRELESTVRYDLLETIHEFATEQLTESDEAVEIGRRHAWTYLRLAELHAPAIRQTGRRAALERLRLERDNLRAAVRWAIDHEASELALRLGTALVELRGAPPWGVGAGLAEARATITAVLEVGGDDGPSYARMRALEAAGTAAYYTSDNERATAWYLQQLDMAEGLGDLQGATDARFNLLFTDAVLFQAPDLDERLDRVQAGYEALGDEAGQSHVLFVRGQRLLGLGRVREAIRVLEEAMQRYEQRGDVAYQSMTAGTLGNAHLGLGERDAAIHWFIGGVAQLAAELGDEIVITMNMPIGAIAAIERGRPEAAAMIMGAYETMSRKYAIRPPLALGRIFNEYAALERARAELDPLAYAAALERGRQMSLEEATALILAMDAPAA